MSVKEQGRGQRARRAAPGGQQVWCDQEMDFQTAPISSNCGERIAEPYVNPRGITPVGAPLNEGTGTRRKLCPHLKITHFL